MKEAYFGPRTEYPDEIVELEVEVQDRNKNQSPQVGLMRALLVIRELKPRETRTTTPAAIYNLQPLAKEPQPASSASG